MALTHGHAITAEEIERIVSREFTAVKFAALCNTVSWALSDQKCDSLPSFTERVNVGDDGLDVEWHAAFPEGDSGSPLLGPGLNAFQYKQRDIFAAGIGVRGLLSVHLEESRRQIQAVIDSDSTPPAARTWLDRVADDLRQRSETALVSEFDEQINDFKFIAENEAAPERVWAVRTLILNGKLNSLREIFSRDALVRLLPNLNLPNDKAEETRRIIERWN